MPSLLRPAMLASTTVAALLLLSGPACSKRSPDLTPPAAAETSGRPSGAASGAKPDEGKPDESPPPGVDLSKLDDLGRKVFFRIVNKEASACGKAHSLIVSLRTDRSCRKSLYAVRYVAHLVDAGFTDSEIGERLEQRYRAGAPKKIDLQDAPVKGNPNAPVAIVEFADFECPACRRVQPVLRQLLEDYPTEVKLYYKNYPLPMHTNARTAAEAAIAAHLQGKFWPYAEKIFANADSITPAALEQWAKEVGADVAKWRKDFESQAVKDRVQKDKTEGAALGIDGTPRIFINGRHFVDGVEPDNLKDWINEELGR